MRTWQGAAPACSQLRVPAGSRLQKVHNVRLALEKFRKGGIEGMFRIQPDDIVDGHREKTLALLWLVSPGVPLQPRRAEHPAPRVIDVSLTDRSCGITTSAIWS
jgi:hypothetical protein